MLQGTLWILHNFCMILLALAIFSLKVSGLCGLGILSMVRSINLLVIGAALGAVLVWLGIRGSQAPVSPIVTPDPALMRCESELAQLGLEIQELRRIAVGAKPSVDIVEHAPAHNGSDSAELSSSSNSDAAHQAVNQAVNQAVAWQISAIERFVPLSEGQRLRLANKFAEERKAREEGRESSAESLEEILGEDNAQTYRGQVKAAFDRVRNEELEKDTVWLARRLGLSPDQEASMRTIFEDVERAVAVEYPQPALGAGATPQQRVLRMIAENKRRVQLRAERLRQILPPDQYQAYMKAESESAAADMEVFHGSGDQNQGEQQESLQTVR